MFNDRGTYELYIAATGITTGPGRWPRRRREHGVGKCGGTG